MLETDDTVGTELHPNNELVAFDLNTESFTLLLYLSLLYVLFHDINF